MNSKVRNALLFDPFLRKSSATWVNNTHVARKLELASKQNFSRRIVIVDRCIIHPIILLHSMNQHLLFPLPSTKVDQITLKNFVVHIRQRLPFILVSYVTSSFFISFFIPQTHPFISFDHSRLADKIRVWSMMCYNRSAVATSENQDTIWQMLIVCIAERTVKCCDACYCQNQKLLETTG